MPDAFESHEQLPFRPGTAPFRVKGSAYRGHIEYVDKVIPGGMPATLERVRDDVLRAFFGQSFMRSSFYDVFPLVAMGYVCARLTGQTFPDFLRVRARWQCDNDISGVYRMFLRLASPSFLATKLPALAAQYFDFGTAEIVRTEPNVVEAQRGGIPELLAPWMTPIIDSYVVRALELNGAKNPRSKVYPFRRESEQHGMAIGSTRMLWTWD